MAQKQCPLCGAMVEVADGFYIAECKGGSEYGHVIKREGGENLWRLPHTRSFQDRLDGWGEALDTINDDLRRVAGIGER